MAATPGPQAGLGVVAVGDRDLLGPAGQVGAGGEIGAPVGPPRSVGELQAAVVPVAGVDRPVAARLAARDAVPHGCPGQVEVAGLGAHGHPGTLRGHDHHAVDDLLAGLAAVDRGVDVGDLRLAVLAGRGDLGLAGVHRLRHGQL